MPADRNVVPPKERTAVILLSGGIDSCVAAELLVRYGWKAIGLWVDYGQRNRNSEEIASREIASHYKIPLRPVVVRMPPTFASPLLGNADPKPHPKRSPWFVPARNSILLALALGIVDSEGLNAIFIGATLEDNVAFPDCRTAYLDAFEATAEKSLERKVRVVAPLNQMRKLDVVRTGIDLGAPLEKTVTCYRADGGVACGACDSCTIRLAAFEKLGQADPARYRANLPR